MCKHWELFKTYTYCYKSCDNNVLQITIKEEDRLSSIVADIDEDVKIVPRSSFVKTPTGLVVPNRSFEGNDCLLYFRIRQVSEFLCFFANVYFRTIVNKLLFQLHKNVKFAFRNNLAQYFLDSVNVGISFQRV